MKRFVILFLLSVTAHAGEWTRISPNTISFNGEITDTDVAKFQQIYSPTDTTVILNSTGGKVVPALAIAETLIKNKNLETIVQGLCASSCANYLFLAGKTRKIDHGVVGYHGSIEAYLSSSKFHDDLSKVDPQVAAKQLPKLKQLAQKEAEFFAEAGVSQNLFIRTQNENDSGLYDVYVPGPHAFLRYGIRNLVGVQDLDLMRSMRDRDGIKIFYDDSSGSAAGTPESSGYR